MELFAWLARFAADVGGLGILLNNIPRPSDAERNRANPTLRDRLLDLIRRRPGVRLSSLWRSLDADRGTAKYHLLLLERAHKVEALRTKRLTRYFPAEMGLQDRTVFALLRRGRVLEMARAVARDPGLAQHHLTDRLKMSRKVFRHYANLLVELDLLRETPGQNAKRYWATEQLEGALATLELENPGRQAAEPDVRGEAQP